jgi:dTDP-4-amino-4,6-dideoxygalactose transaminase
MTQQNIPFAKPDITEGEAALVRDELIEELKKRGVGTSVHFIPLHMHPYYRETYGYAPGDFPVAHDLYGRSLSLPIHPKMTDSDVSKVIESLLGLL